MTTHAADAAPHTSQRHGPSTRLIETIAGVKLRALVAAMLNEGLDPHVVREILVKGINGLPNLSRLVLSLYCVEHLTPAEIAQVLGLTQARVYLIQAKAIQTLRLTLATRYLGGNLASVAVPGERRLQWCSH